jgi:acyl-CoA synthetase (AMP-forming)/AMP-acid ligase II/aryl carrier-like protein
MTLIDIVRNLAATEKFRVAYTFLTDGERVEENLAYGELDLKARAIGALLEARLESGSRAMLLFPPGLDFITAFLGCLYARVIAVPAYPPRRMSKHERSNSRLETIVKDAGINAILTTSVTLPHISEFASSSPGAAGIQLLPTDDLPIEMGAEWKDPGARGETVAFLQYTSGSTATPRGVIVSHENLMHNERMIQKTCGHTAESTFVGWLPFYHDMGLIGNVLQPLFTGSRCVLMAPSAFLQKPLRWLSAITRFRGRTSGGPNFAYDLCVRRIPPEQREGLDLSSWTVAFNGAEPVRAETLERFVAAFSPYGFRRETFFPCYGLAEATLIVSGGPKGQPNHHRRLDSEALEQNMVSFASRSSRASRIVAGCGKPVSDTIVRIVNPETGRACSESEIGEIWVSGPAVAQGYWGQPDKTRETFNARLANEPVMEFLRTGDLGFSHNEELYITGRLRDLIIIRGNNHYAEDIEWTVRQYVPSLHHTLAAAFSVDVNDAERLVIVLEQERNKPVVDGQLADEIRQAVAREHGLQVYDLVSVKQGEIPKTSSGKIQRHVCKNKYLLGELQVLAANKLHVEAIEMGEMSIDCEAPFVTGSENPIDSWEDLLRGLVMVVLKTADIDANKALVSLGLDSVMAAELKHRIEVDTGATVNLSELLGGATIRTLAARISGVGGVGE